MKILMVLTNEFPPDRRVHDEMISLINAGYVLHIACYTKENRPQFEILEGINIHRKPISNLIHKLSVAALRLPFYFSFWKKFVEKIISEYTIDAIHIHDLPLAKIGADIKRTYQIPLIVDLHENWPASLETATHTNTLAGKILSSNKQWRRYEKRILKHADAIITVVDEMKDRISNLGIKKEKIIIVSNTVEPDNFPLYKEIPDPNFITLFYAGGINIHRGLQVVLNAMPAILKEKPNVRLNIIGTGSYQIQLEKLVSDLNLKNFVNFLGWKNLNEISKFLAQSDIALIPHLKSEQTDCSSPNKLYQYIYAQKPILTSNCDSLVRIVEETKSGISYLHNSPEDFKRALFEMLDSKNNNLDLNFGLNLIQTKYNWGVDSQRLIQLYKDL
jgi:glycosyltransferase involved in cell wall biosynthesis